LGGYFHGLSVKLLDSRRLDYVTVGAAPSEPALRRQNRRDSV